MQIDPFLARDAFDPELIEEMSAALSQVRKTLGLTTHEDQKTTLIARHIISLAQNGMRSQTAFYLDTMQQFRPSVH